MKKYLYNPPELLKNVFNNFIWKTSNNKILFTFDDGPNPDITEQILTCLNQNNIRAIFFCVGDNLKKFSNLTREVISERHTIGNHTYYHNKLTQLNFDNSVQTINAVNMMMKDDYNYTIKYFRPPHGRITLKTNKLMQTTGMKCVMWNLLTYDYKKELKKVKFSIDNYLQKNSIIVLHDNIKTKAFIVDAIHYIVEIAAKKGCEIGEPEECLN